MVSGGKATIMPYVSLMLPLSLRSPAEAYAVQRRRHNQDAKYDTCLVDLIPARFEAVLKQTGRNCAAAMHSKAPVSH